MTQFCPSDGSFGPGIGSCRGGFDFTLTFEESILALAPQALLLLLAPLRYFTLRSRRRRVARASHLGFLKLLTSGLCMASSLLLLVLWADVKDYRTRSTIPSSVLEFLGSLAITIISRLEHTRAVRPSHLLQLFLLAMLACDAVRLRTLFLMRYTTSLVTAACIHTFLTGSLLLLESLDKRQLLSADLDRRLPEEETVGLFGQKFFLYLNSLFYSGYKKVLSPRDLHSIDSELISDELRNKFATSWKEHHACNSKASLKWSLLNVLFIDFLLPIPPQLLYMGTTLAQPFLISAMVTYVQNSDQPQNHDNGYGLIAAFALNYTLLAVFNGWYQQSVSRLETKVRTGLVSLIYEKTLLISPKDINTGSGTVLMNVDVEKVLDGIRTFHEFWSLGVLAAIASFLLYRQLGISFLAPIFTIIIVVSVCYCIGRRIRTRSFASVAATEKRVTSLSYAAGATKGIRMLGLSETVHYMLSSLREIEVSKQNPDVKLTSLANVIFELTSLTAYATYTLVARAHGGTLDYARLFSSLSTLKLVTTPMVGTLQYIPTLQAALASLERIRTYLLLEDFHAGTTSQSNYDVASTSITRESRSEFHLETFERPSECIYTRDADFASEVGRPLLSEISITISTHRLSMVTGKVGSGKSLLLQSLAGEMDLVRGEIHRPKHGIAFCAQTPWLRNATIRENILGESLYERSWYLKVTWSCGLFQDFNDLKLGDQTRVGSKGIALSGGQKNRICLARAVYSRKPTMLIDDVLSGLDSTTEKHVFRHVFGQDGIIRQSNTTVVLATHSRQWLPQADLVIVVEGGRILESGPFHSLKSASISLLDQKSTHHDSDSVEEANTIEESWEMEQKEGSKALDALDGDRRSGDRKSLVYYLSAVGRKHLTLYTVLLIAWQIATTMQYLWLKWWAGDMDTSVASQNRHLIIFVGLTILAVVLAAAYLVHFLLRFMPLGSIGLHSRQLRALTHAAYSFVVSTDIGSITNRFSQDILLVDTQLPNGWINFNFAICQIISSLGIMISATPPVAALVPFLSCAAFIIQRIYLRTSRQIRLMDLEAKAPLCTHFLETLAGISTIRAFGWSEAYASKNKSLLDQSQVPFYLLLAIQNWLKLVLELMVAGVIIIVVGLGVALRSKVDPGYLGLALVGGMDLGLNLQLLVTKYTMLETSLSAVARIRHFAEDTPLEGNDSNANNSLVVHSGSVNFRHLKAGYSDVGVPVLQGIDLTIRAGEKLGICGRTGSGKSTLVAALFGLLYHNSGSLEIDGADSSSVTLESLRASIVALPQDPLLLSGSIRNNLAPWPSSTLRPHASDEQMQGALSKVGLWDKLISATTDTPHQSPLDISMDNTEAVLSQGERQLFCLARAILMPGRIVVLDEATSSVDVATDNLMQSTIRTEFEGRTIIAIAHRLNTILDFDRVVVMDAGRIAEVGAPRNLMMTEQSLFKGLVEAQMHG